MFRNLSKCALALLTFAGGAQSQAAEAGYTLQYVVPVQCSITFSAGASAADRNMVGLGSLHEYCNSAQGYDLIVRYPPGTLRGTVLIAGEGRVILDGSGMATIDRSPIPRNRYRTLAAIPGQNGFDTDRLEFALIPSQTATAR